MSISSRITSMEQHIGNAYDKLDELGVDLTNVNKNINNIAGLLDEIYEDYPKTTTTNVTEPSIDNTKAGKMEIDLKGNTEQDGEPTPDNEIPVEVVSGENKVKVVNKNLFDKNNVNIYNGYADYNIWVSNANHRTIYIPCKPNTTYTVTKTNEGSNVRFAVITCPTIPETGTSATDTLKDNSATHITKTTGVNDYYLAVWCYVTNDTGVTWQEVIDSIQIEENTTATTYEEHKEQDFPISLHSRNLINLSNLTEHTYNGVTFTPIYENGNLQYINVNGTATANANYYLGEQAKVTLNSGTYTWGGGATNINLGIEFGGVYYNTSASRPITLTQTTTSGQPYIQVLSGKSVENSKIYPQLEKGTTATTYQPFYDYELCKIGEYQDYIYKNNGSWYMKKNISKVVFDGTQTWSKRNDIANLTNTSCFRGSYSTEINSNAISGTVQISNKFTCLNNTNDVEHLRYTGAENYRFQLFINKSRLSTDDVAGLNSYLSSNNVPVYLPTTPIDIEITDSTLINQLEAIYNTAKSYDNVTNIIQENNNLPFILDIKTLKKS